jgi:hypothetical protein
MTTASSAAVTVVQDSLDTQTTTNGTSEHHEFKDGDVVRVIDDLSKVRQLQEGHGGWLDLMALVCVHRQWNRRGRGWSTC